MRNLNERWGGLVATKNVLVLLLIESNILLLSSILNWIYRNSFEFVLQILFQTAWNEPIHLLILCFFPRHVRQQVKLLWKDRRRFDCTERVADRKIVWLGAHVLLERRRLVGGRSQDVHAQFVWTLAQVESEHVVLRVEIINLETSRHLLWASPLCFKRLFIRSNRFFWTDPTACIF